MNRRLNEWSGMLFLTAALSMIGAFRASALVIDGFEPDEQVVYKTIGTTELKLHVFNPMNHNPSDQRPAIIFFFGGGWVGGSPTQFHPQCEYLASRGMVAMSAEYRVESVHGTTPRECVKDGKSAIRWIRTHASELGINPDQIAAGGGSAGGQIAAAAGTTSGFEEEGEDLAISSCPDALVLFNPVYDNGPTGWGYDKVQDYWEDFSPMHNISETTPPTVVFLGTEDALIPVATAEEYKSRMELLGLRNDLYLYEGQGHGFFNYNEESYSETLVDMDDFLVSLGLLTPASIFTGGVLGTASDWTDGLPGSGNPGTVVVDGSLGHFGQADAIFSGATVTVGGGATLTATMDFPAGGANTWIINDATVNLSDDFFSNDNFFTLNAGSSVNAVDDFKAQSNDGNITINGGMHTAGDEFGSTAYSSTLDFLGGNVVAGRLIFDVGVVTIGGTAVASATGTTLATAVEGNVNVLSGWTGSLTAENFSGTTWSNVVVGNWTLDETPIDGTLFDANFIVSADGKTLSITEVVPDSTVFNGGALGTASDWSNGLPGPGNPGTVDVNGVLGNYAQATVLFSGATVTVGGGATLSGGIDFPAGGGNTWIINDATVNLGDDFFSNDSFFILNEGSSVNAADGFTGQGDGGNITINGGSHTAAGNNEGTGFGTSPSPRTSTLNFLGGNVVAGSFSFKNGLVTIGGTAVATATGTTPTADAQGNVNVLSDWTGWLRADSFTGSTWRDAVLAGTWTLDGTPIDGTLFDANFLVSADGRTLSLTALPDPEPVSRLRIFLLGGQSNADGRADPSGQPTYTDIDFYSDTETRPGALTGLYSGSSETSQFGPELTFGRRLSDVLACDSTNRLAIIKYANGGTDLKYEWKAGGDATTTGDGTEYVAFQQAVSDGLAALATQYTGAVINIEGMIWMQGERDAVQGYTNDYQANMTAFIADVRTTYGTNLPFVIGRLSDVQTAISVSSLEAIQAAQSAAAASDYRTGLVETDDLSIKIDNIHFDAAGQLELGKRFSVEMAYLLWVKSQLTSADIDAGKGEPNADPDMDGIVNMDEFISGTDVAISNSMFLVSMDIIGSNVLEIQHFSHSGRLYQIESSSNLVDQVWIPHAVFTNDISGMMTHTITNSLPTSFIRVRAALP